MKIADKDLELYFYETAMPEERSEMRREQYEDDDNWWEDDRYYEYE